MSNNITIDELAGIIKNEFDGVGKRFDKMEGQLKDLKQGQENIELKLTNVAYRFELQNLEMKVKKLSERVEVLEKK